MEPPLSRVMPCPECGDEHLYLPCDFCECTAVTIPGVYPSTDP